MTKAVKRLYDLEIDEISLVDRPANQHGVVAIAKRHQEEDMPGLFDADGDEVMTDELEFGDFVYDEEGNEYQFVPEAEDGTTSELYDDEDEYDDELVGVGKNARFVAGTNGVESVVRSKIGAGRRKVPGSNAIHRSSTAALERSARLRRQADSPFAQMGRDDSGRAFGGNLRTRAQAGGRRAQAAALDVYGNHPKSVIAGTTTTAAGGGGYAEHRRRSRKRGVHKSLGESVYEELSKALGQDDRDQVISKMADEVEIYKSQAEQAMAIAEELAYERELEAYTEIAKGYNLPVDPHRLGEILKNAADTLPEEDLADLDRLLQAQSEMYSELGTNGSMATSNVMDQVQSMALQTVGKADISESEAVVALFAANPAAYDEYLTEQRG